MTLMLKQEVLSDPPRKYTITIKEVVIVPKSYVPLSVVIPKSTKLNIYGNTCYYNNEQKLLVVVLE